MFAVSGGFCLICSNSFIFIFAHFLLISVDKSFFRRYLAFISINSSQVGNLEFPSKRFFGNRAESFVRLRRAQLEVCVSALLH